MNLIKSIINWYKNKKRYNNRSWHKYTVETEFKKPTKNTYEMNGRIYYGIQNNINYNNSFYYVTVKDFLSENYKDLDIRNGTDYKVEILIYMKKAQSKYTLDGLEDINDSIFQCLIHRPDGVKIKKSITIDEMTELFISEIFYDASGKFFNEIKSKYKKE